MDNSEENIFIFLEFPVFMSECIQSLVVKT